MNDVNILSADHLARVRSSLACLLAQALTELRPAAQLGLGVATDDGFQLDVVTQPPLTPEDFPGLEQRMRELLVADWSVVQRSAADDLVQLSLARQPFQLEHVQRLLADAVHARVTLYRSGQFSCLSAAPLLDDLAQIPADCFALQAIAGAYWRGDADNVMMTRISAWAFCSCADLEAHARAVEQALQSDHKKLGRELELFAFDDEIGPGLPLWLPHGTVIRSELEKLMEELEFDAGFERVATPHLARVELYERTGHLPYYADSMFPFMQHPDDAAGARFALKPMNCPHHHKIFAARKRSYRELPFRISEYGHVFRYEDSGAVSGLLRTRCMCMNDAHIYCDQAQVKPELHAVLAMHRQVYELLGLHEYRVRLSSRGPVVRDLGARGKFVDDDAGWLQSEQLLRDVLLETGMPFFEGPGEAAFYGPKIDFQFRTVTGREETASTLQLDFAMARRLGLSYVASDGKPQQPFIIHRAPLGTHERFVALLIERFAGAFPTWLAPVQARVIPVSAAQEAYAREVQAVLRERRIRAELDLPDQSLGKRIRSAVGQKVPNLLVVGERERAQRSVSWRRHGSAEQQDIGLEALRDALVERIATRSLDVLR